MMFPQKEDIADLPFSEREVYEFLEKLGDNYADCIKTLILVELKLGFYLF